MAGGSRGMGAAIARRLAEDGADVAMSYAASAEKAEANVRELEVKGVRAAAFKADQADPAQVEGLVKAIVEHFGRLDILVNSAGVFVTGLVGDPATDMAALQRQFAINVGGVAAAVRAAALPRRARSDHLHRLGGWQPLTLARNCRLLRDQGGGCRLHTRMGTRPRIQRHRRQCNTARPHRHGYELGQWRARGGAEGGYSAWPLWEARGSRRCGCVFGEFRGRFH